MQLDSIYASPGLLLLAESDDGSRLGCAGLRAMETNGGDHIGEIRRLFVRERGRATGLGRRLASQLVATASAHGFDRLVLNTLPEMSQAISLYESMGFERCDPYVEEPLEGVLYFHRRVA